MIKKFFENPSIIFENPSIIFISLSYSEKVSVNFLI